MVALTDRQKEVYEFITDFVFKNQYPPSRRDIMAGTGLRSPASVEYFLRVISRKGHLVLMSRTCRAIRFTCDRCPYCGAQKKK